MRIPDVLGHYVLGWMMAHRKSQEISDKSI
jgi:hypothetical protein